MKLIRIEDEDREWFRRASPDYFVGQSRCGSRYDAMVLTGEDVQQLRRMSDEQLQGWLDQWVQGFMSADLKD